MLPVSVVSSAVALVAFAFSLGAGSAKTVDRRVVDVAEAGDARSELAHGFAGHDVIAGTIDGKPYRQTRGWMHFAMTTFEDTEVTVSLTFAGIDTVTRQYDIVVEDSVLATRTLTCTR